MHGAYGCGLDEVMVELNEYIPLVSVSIAVFGLVLVFIAIRFFRKRKNEELYTEPLKVPEQGEISEKIYVIKMTVLQLLPDKDLSEQFKKVRQP